MNKTFKKKNEIQITINNKIFFLKTYFEVAFHVSFHAHFVDSDFNSKMLVCESYF